MEVPRVDCQWCGAVRRERLDFLVENALHTKRFSPYVGQRCRSGMIRDVTAELHLDWQTVKRLEMGYMREQIRHLGTPGPKVIEIDEISIRNGHSYRIVVSVLERRQPIWFGGEDRSEASMDQFYRFFGKKKAKRIRLAVMDMWQAFRNGTVPNNARDGAYFKTLQESVRNDIDVNFVLSPSTTTVDALRSQCSVYAHACRHGVRSPKDYWKCEHFGITLFEAVVIGCSIFCYEVGAVVKSSNESAREEHSEASRNCLRYWKTAATHMWTMASETVRPICTGTEPSWIA
jgi:hypothetical protein